MKHLLLYTVALLVAAGSVSLTSCKEEKQPDERVDIFPIYKKVFTYTSLTDEERQARIDSFLPVFKAYSYLFKEDLTTDSAMAEFSVRPMQQAFVPVVDALLPNERIDSVEVVTAKSFDRLKSEFPGIKTPHLYGVVTPYVRKIYVVDSIMMISLNHYLGSGFEGYSSWPEFRQSVARLSLMPYNIIEAWLGSQYPFKSLGQDRALDHFIYGGVMAYAKLKLVPDANEQDALSYDQRRWKWANENEKQVWEKMLELEIPFSTEPDVVERLTLQRQASDMIHPEAPGRIGVYIGYKIVKAYMEKYPDTKLSDMFNPEFYNDPKLLQKSGYTGQK